MTSVPQDRAISLASPGTENSTQLSRHDAQKFAEKWSTSTQEKQRAQSFWRDFFHDVCQLGDLLDLGIEFEHPIRSHKTHTIKFIDVYWPGVLLVEHKSAGRNLDDAETQGREYLASLPSTERPTILITSDFTRIRITDIILNDTLEFPLTDLPEHLHRIERIIEAGGRKATEVETLADRSATQLMADLYKELSHDGYTGHDASVLLVRLLFLMFGDDTDMWQPNLFLTYLEDTREDGSDTGTQLMRLFQTLDTPQSERSRNLPASLTAFPYVNGQLFTEHIAFPDFNTSMRAALLKATRFDWSSISPVIFGSLFQNIKSREDRHAGGQHFTSEKNILKVIRPLFLDDYAIAMWDAWDDGAELEKVRQSLGERNYLDPACGSGNFLIVAYKELRAFELKILARQAELNWSKTQLSLDGTSDLAVKLEQFHGIEIDEWPAQIARVAMFLVEHQLNIQLETLTGVAPRKFPLTHSARIENANALQVDWRTVCPINNDTIIMGNPPFLGSNMRSPEQTADQKNIWGKISGGGSIDFVANWFLLAGRYMKNTHARAAFVSTNSITQGEQPAVLWGQLYPLGMGIDFAHRTFPWANDAQGRAAVHCVIIGFSANSKEPPLKLWDYPTGKGESVKNKVENINSYLVEAPNTLLFSRSQPFGGSVPLMSFGSMPNDNGFLSKINEEEANRIRLTDSIATAYLRKFMGADELIKGKKRYCFWLCQANPSDIRNSQEIINRVEQVRKTRARSLRASTRNLATTPTLFGEIRQPAADYIAVPRVSSETREYVPIAILSSDIIASDALLTVSPANLFTFGMLMSSVFNTWNRTVSGRLESRYRISAEITYNNFPFPEPTPEQEAQIEFAAQAVLDARLLYPTASLADLYDPLAMPIELRRAHQQLDKAVLRAYGLLATATDSQILAELFRRYEEGVKVQ